MNKYMRKQWKERACVRVSVEGNKGAERSHGNLFDIIFVSWLEKQPTFNINSAGSMKSMGLDNRKPSTGWCPRRKRLSRNNRWGRSEVLGNRAKLNILCPLWRTEEGDKCLCV
jgi:hypothetical protein